MKIILSLPLFFIFLNFGFTENKVKGPDFQDVGIDEKLGERIPLDLEFIAENGQKIKLRELINKPTLITLVYYTCSAICNPLLGGVAQVLEQLKNEIQNNFQVVTISFNPSDTAELARNKKKNYLQSIDNSIPPESWRFLVGDKDTIKKFTRAVGFKYKKQGDEYIHAAGSFMVSADGKIIRYLYGIAFLPFDLKMAVTEALQSKVGSTIRQVILLCFSYDPQSHKYVFNVTRVIGTVMLVFVIILFSFLVLLGRKIKREKSAKA